MIVLECVSNVLKYENLSTFEIEKDRIWECFIEIMSLPKSFHKKNSLGIQFI